MDIKKYMLGLLLISFGSAQLNAFDSNDLFYRTVSAVAATLCVTTGAMFISESLSVWKREPTQGKPGYVRLKVREIVDSLGAAATCAQGAICLAIGVKLIFVVLE